VVLYPPLAARPFFLEGRLESERAREKELRQQTGLLVYGTGQK